MLLFKLFINDFFLFALNILILMLIYTSLSIHINISIEIILLIVSYYIISSITTMSAILTLYIMVKSAFITTSKYTIFKKLELTSYIFDKYYDDINSFKDFELKLKEINLYKSSSITYT